MAAQVNKKFLIVLLAIFAALAIAAGAAFFVILSGRDSRAIEDSKQAWAEATPMIEQVDQLMDDEAEARRNGDDDRADELLAEAEAQLEVLDVLVKSAEQKIGKVVDRDPGNTEARELWVRFMSQLREDDEDRFQKKFLGLAQGIVQNAEQRQTNMDAQIRHLQFQLDAFLAGVPAQVTEQRTTGARELVRYVDQYIEQTEGVRPEGWEKVLKYRAFGNTILAFRELARAGSADDKVVELATSAQEDIDTYLAAFPDEPAGAIALRTIFELVRLNGAILASESEQDQFAEYVVNQIATLEQIEQRAGGDPIASVVRSTLLGNSQIRTFAGLQPLIDDGAPTPVWDEYIAELQEGIDAIEALPEERIDDAWQSVFLSLRRVEPAATNTFAYESTRRILERVAGLDRRNVLARLQLAETAELAGRFGAGFDDFEQALEAIDEIRNTPQLPLSVEGMVLLRERPRLADRESAILLGRWNAAQLVGDAETATADAERLRRIAEEFAAETSEDDRALAMCRARASFAEGKTDEASAFAQAALEAGEPLTAQTSWMLGRIAMSQGNTTLAIRYLEPVRDYESSAQIGYRIDLARAYESDRRPSEALAIYQSLQRRLSEGTSPFVDNRVNVLRASLGQGELADPEQQAIIEAQLALRGEGLAGGDPLQAIAVLEAAIADLGPRTRLFERIAEIHIDQGEVESAIATLERLQAAGAAEQRHADLIIALSEGDIVSLALNRVDSLDISESERARRRASILSQQGSVDQAKQELDAALDADPDNIRLIQARFDIAVSEESIPDAERLAQRATQLDADKADGAYFRGIVASMKTDRAQALSLLEQAADLRPNNVTILRALANEQALAQQTSEALSTYRNAVTLRANDRGLLFEYISLLRNLDRDADALEVLRDAEDVVRRTPVLRSIRLDLEARVGDRPAALAARRQILEQDPSDIQNAAALIRLYHEFRQWDEARSLIDELRGSNDSLTLVSLDAEWHALQNNPDEGQRVFVGYLQTVFEEGRPEEAPDIYVSLGDYFDRRGMLEKAAAEYDRAANLSGNTNLLALSRLAAMQRRLNQHERAAETIRTLIDASGREPEPGVVMQLAQNLYRAGKLDEAAETLAPLESRESFDYKVTILRARIAEKRDDLAGARAALDAAIQRFPDAADLYASRAELSYNQGVVRDEATKKRLFSSALQDIDRALERDDTRSELYRFKAVVSLDLENQTEAANAYREAVRASRGARQVTFEAVTRMLRISRTDDAAEFADLAIRENPTDGDLLSGLGAIFSRVGQPELASRYRRLAWERSPNPVNGLAYAQSLLAQDPPRASGAQAIFSELGGAAIEEDWALLLCRALMFLAQSRPDAAAQDATRAFEITQTLEDGQLRWFAYVDRHARSDEDRIALFDAIALREAWRDWAAYFTARVQSDQPEAPSQAEEILIRLASNAQPEIQTLATLQAADLYVLRSEYQRAEQLLRAALTRQPQQPRFLAALGYVLARGDINAQEAFDLATTASQLAPESPEAFNALGWANWKLGNEQDALNGFNTALSFVRTIPKSGRIGIAFSIAAVHADLGDAANANAYMRLVEIYIEDGDELAAPDKAAEPAQRAKIDSLG